MKKILFIFACLLTMQSVRAESKMDSIYNYFHPILVDEHLSANFLIGTLGAFDGRAKLTIGGSFTFWRIHADFTICPVAHMNDEEVGVWENQSGGWSFHFGYRFAFHRLGVTPVIGMASQKKGTVNGWIWKPGDKGVVNQFTPKEKHSGFDYGVNIDYHLAREKGLKVSALITRYALYAGIGLFF